MSWPAIYLLIGALCIIPIEIFNDYQKDGYPRITTLGMILAISLWPLYLALVLIHYGTRKH